MLTPNLPGDVLSVPADIYKRAAVSEFQAVVNSQIPDLDVTLDRALALAYYFAFVEDQGPDVGAAARAVMAPLFGFTTEQAEGLLAAGYATLFPALVSEALAKQAEAHIG